LKFDDDDETRLFTNHVNLLSSTNYIQTDILIYMYNDTSHCALEIEYHNFITNTACVSCCKFKDRDHTR